MEQLYTLVDILHQKVVGDFRMKTITDYFDTDDVYIQLAIKNNEIVGDRYMITMSENKNFNTYKSYIKDSPLSSKERKISYIYRHLYKYGNTITSDNPKKYLDSVRYLGIDYIYKKVHDNESKQGKYFYVLERS